MSWRPDASLEMLRQRAQWLSRTRDFFRQRQVLEVETPQLSSASIPDPNIQSLQTTVHGRPQYLQTSPELYMKRLLAAGSGPVYQVSRVFRDAEVGRWHNPEFTLVEWYQPGFSLQQLMQEVADLVIHLCELERDGLRVEAVTYRQLFEKHTGINPLYEDRQSLIALCNARQLDCPVIDEDWGSAMDWLLAMVIQPQMQGLVFVYDYPASQASLARLDPNNPDIARRFELFIDGIEMANGFEELTDVHEQLQRFHEENRRRALLDMEQVVMDEMFLDALRSGLPETAGVALGLDRLLMWSTGSSHINQVMSFAWKQGD